MDWGGANSRFLGLVSVWAARSFDQTALRPSVIKRIRQIDVKIHNTYHKLRCHCVNTCHCVNMHVWAPEVHSPLNSFGYWTLNKYYYYYIIIRSNVVMLSGNSCLNPYLDFSIIYNLSNNHIERLQRIQHQAACMLKRIPRRNDITPV